jgi:hypothetical protein
VVDQLHRRHRGDPARAFRGLALVFALSFVNLIGVLATATAVGDVAPWSRWQFMQAG